MMSSNSNDDEQQQHQQHQQSNNGEVSKQQQQQLATIAPLSTLLPPPHLHTFISSWLQDDVPSHFDVGGYVVGSNIQVAELYMKSPGVLAGIPFFNAVFAACGECVVQWEEKVVEGMGCYMGPGHKMKLATVTGPVSHLLRGERTALNTLSRCSGVATASRQCANLAKAVVWHGEVAGTRKTTPGPFRTVEKYGLLVGGASTHRLDLSQMVMLKDNHIWACNGSIEAAVHKARSACGFSCKIEVECQSLEEALLAAKAGANIIMLDNYTQPSKLKDDAKLFKEQYPHVLVEASGGITMETLGEYMCEYVDVISLGMLTQGYDCVDYSLKIVH
jgi:nicotinate-nucleotide pyrophosphorylase (carboxylating)